MSTLFIAERDDRWLGLAGGELLDPAEAPDTAEVISMWVEPAARRLGIAHSLLDAVATWARTRGVAHLQLWVTEGNTPATALYKRFGFALTDDKQRVIPSDPTRLELLMRMPLPSPATP